MSKKASTAAMMAVRTSDKEKWCWLLLSIGASADGPARAADDGDEATAPVDGCGVDGVAAEDVGSAEVVVFGRERSSAGAAG